MLALYAKPAKPRLVAASSAYSSDRDVIDEKYFMLPSVDAVHAAAPATLPAHMHAQNQPICCHVTSASLLRFQRMKQAPLYNAARAYEMTWLDS